MNTFMVMKTRRKRLAWLRRKRETVNGKVSAKKKNGTKSDFRMCVCVRLAKG